MGKQERKVLKMSENNIFINIISHVKSNLSNDLKSSNDDSVKVMITCASSTLENVSSSNAVFSYLLTIDMDYIF